MSVRGNLGRTWLAAVAMVHHCQQQDTNLIVTRAIFEDGVALLQIS
jgi:hypothetical protein